MPECLNVLISYSYNINIFEAIDYASSMIVTSQRSFSQLSVEIDDLVVTCSQDSGTNSKWWLIEAQLLY